MLGQELLKPGERLVYDLYAATAYTGNVGMGRYTAYVKNHHTKNWHEIDDTDVRDIDADEVDDKICSKDAYNLFFRRRSCHEKHVKEDVVDFDAYALRPEAKKAEEDRTLDIIPDIELDRRFAALNKESAEYDERFGLSNKEFAEKKQRERAEKQGKTVAEMKAEE